MGRVFDKQLLTFVKTKTTKEIQENTDAVGPKDIHTNCTS